jgi:hypothetical protein
MPERNMTVSAPKIVHVIGGILVGLLAWNWAGAVTPNRTSEPEIRAVPRVAQCAAGDHPEVALQGQVPAAMRANGFDGFNCNLAVAGQYVGTGGGITFASIQDDHGHFCAYYSTGFAGGVGGSNVIDVSDPAKPLLTATLKSTAMLNPWESMRVNANRQLLIALSPAPGGPSVPGMPVPTSAKADSVGVLDVYDLAADCRSPKLLASMQVGTGKDGGILAPKSIQGHDSNFSLDGQTLYSGDPAGKTYSAIDLKDPSRPRMISQVDVSQWPLNGSMFNGSAHGMSLSDNGKRGYFVSVGMPKVAELADPNANSSEGFYVVDTSDIQARKPNPQFKPISYLTFKNGSTAQHTLAIKIRGKPYVVFVDEAGSGGFAGLGGGTAQDACNAGLSPFPLGRIVDISDEAKPRLVSYLALETHVPANCSKVMPDLVGQGGFTYGSHICSVDNRDNATALACGYAQSGIRVFDIRDPATPKEIAYYNPKPPGEVKSSPDTGAAPARQSKVDLCAAPAGFDFKRKLLTTACSSSGALILKFENGVWPMKESTPAPRGVSYN